MSHSVCPTVYGTSKLRQCARKGPAAYKLPFGNWVGLLIVSARGSETRSPPLDDKPRAQEATAWQAEGDR